MGIGEKIRKRRLELDFSRSQLAKEVQVTPSAIANYENGISYPKLDIMVSLMEALDIDANYLFRDYLSDSVIRRIYGGSLSEDEKSAIERYRKLTENGKYLVRMIIEEEYNRIQLQEWIELPCWQPGKRMLYSGFILKDKGAVIRIPRKSLPPGTDFCFQIQIESYEPIYKKYDILAMQRRPTVHNEVGIFLLNNVCYIRLLSQVGEICSLRPLNVLEPEVEVKKEDQFECLGTVLGVVYGEYEFKSN